ncbi:hypothetical protein NDU88_003916 [Pleurodeles waltl]|uniref:Uncharacterized protein n=1 Tax=Pleurodeles waltl TaxID=8319 RepID=A0AAV7PAX6_PLEWA|nr:hypothetical protein NDU88_003916 [Pleurodeles waltl]
MAAPGPHSLQDTLDKIPGATEESKTILQREIGQVSVELSLLGADHQELTDRVRCAETTLTDMTPVQQEIHATVVQLTDRVLLLEHRAEDAEG